VWRLVHGLAARLPAPGTPVGRDLAVADRDLHRLVHRTIRRVTDDVVERLHFNTAIAAVMELVTALAAAADRADSAVLREAVDVTLCLLAPFVPHVASELWEVTGHPTALDVQPWPTADPTALVQEVMELPVQVNGKLRGRVTVPADATEAEILAAALAEAPVQAHVGQRPLRRHVVVPGRLVSLVV
jgi:leucyl-tRNA synthetase